ncbi:hypothetical protein NDU88_004797 [Pleurodeles waltl]|uniref:Uncharacterized protein n=1 Tax=Pleurodeles waltl TaxID=8319 RepID=A0AAV7LJE9_PLEWA|nr:hypothetical protein NDU88_004797 [Pleurodeles waltl]
MWGIFAAEENSLSDEGQMHFVPRTGISGAVGKDAESRGPEREDPGGDTRNHSGGMPLTEKVTVGEKTEAANHPEADEFPHRSRQKAYPTHHQPKQYGKEPAKRFSTQAGA